MNVMRWRHSETNPVLADVDAETLFDIGDLLFQEIDDARPAGLLPIPGLREPSVALAEVVPSLFGLDSAAAVPLTFAQLNFHRKFLGVAMQPSVLGCTKQVRVSTTAVFGYDCDPQTFELGDYVGPVLNQDGEALENQRVGKVKHAAHAIGRVVRREASPVTLVLINNVSTVLHGGVQGPYVSI